MARRTASELIANLRNMGVGEGIDGVENLLEDITDSVGDIDPSQYIKVDDYNRVVKERDDAIAARDDLRSRYINRFYSDYNAENDKGYVFSMAPQSQIEKKEKEIKYGGLFE